MATQEIRWNQILRDAQLKIAKANEQATTFPRPSGLADEMEKSLSYRAEFHRLNQADPLARA